MKIRECKAEDVISLLQCAEYDKDMDFLEDWQQYQKWLLDAVYNKKWQVLVADDSYGVIGFLVWNLYQECFKWVGKLNYIYINVDNRKNGVSDKLVMEFIKSIYNSQAQICKFQSYVLPQEWVDTITSNVPYMKSETYHIERTDELKEWFYGYLHSDK